jgi:hypothetical protein
MMHPSAPPIPTPARPIQPIRGLAIGVVITLGVRCLAEVFTSGIAMWRMSLISTVMNSSEPPDVDVLTTNDDLYIAATITTSVTHIIAAIMFVIWLFRARSNAEAITPIPHRRHSAWLIFSWGFPVIALWYPKQIVDDIWTTSMPGGIDSGKEPPSLRYARRSGLIWAWWVTWLISAWVSTMAYRTAGRGDELEDMLATAKIDAYFMPLTLVCATLAVAIVLKITRAQERQRTAQLHQVAGLGFSAAMYRPPPA